MTKYPDSSTDKTDDLDLFALLLKLVFFIKRFGKLILATSLVGIFCGVMIYMALPKSYASKLVLETTLLSNTEEIELINNWDDLLNKSGYAVLAKNFNCNPYILTKLRSIKAESIQKVGTSDAVSGFFIDIIITDTALLVQLQNGILYGLENNEFVKQRIAVRKSNLEGLINDVNKEILKFDSIKSNITEIIRNRKSNGASLMVDVSGISNQQILLREKLVNYQEQLRFSEAIRVLQDFVKSGRPKQPKLSVLIGIGLALGLFLGCCLAFYRLIREKYASLVKSAGGAES